MKHVIRFWIALVLISVFGWIYAADPYMPPYSDTLIFFVHGIDSDRYTWYQPQIDSKIQNNGSEEQWAHYLMTLGITEDRLRPYSFSKKSGYHARNMLELGGIGYKSEGGDPNAENNQGYTIRNDGTKVLKRTGIDIGTSKTWLDQAVGEYKNQLFNNPNINPITNRMWTNVEYIPDALLPSKLVMLAHSQGNFAVRGYIQSGALAREEGFFDGVPDSLLPPQSKALIKENPLGFYQYPVEKVVFINPVLRGGAIHTYLMLRVISNMKRLTEINAIQFGGWGSRLGEVGALVAASSEDNMAEVMSSEFGQWCMTPFVIKGTPIGDIQKTNAELTVLLTDLAVDQLNKKGSGCGIPFGFGNILSWFKPSGGSISWGDFLSWMTRIFPDIDPSQWNNYIATGKIPIPNIGLGMGQELIDWAQSMGDQDIPGSSYLTGITYLAKQSRAKQAVIQGMIDTSAVNASMPSVGDRYQHVGPGGTEKLIKEKVLKDEISMLPGNLSDNIRKWQPKYRVISSEGSIVVDPDATRQAYMAENGLAQSKGLGLDMTGFSLMGIDVGKDPYLGRTIFNPDFLKLKRSQQFFALAASQLGGVFTKPGDVVVGYPSLHGEGVKELELNSVVVYRRENPASVMTPLEDALTMITAIDSAMLVLRFNPFAPIDIPPFIRGSVREAVYLIYAEKLGVDITKMIGDMVTPVKKGNEAPQPNPLFRDLAKHLTVMAYAKSEGHTPDMDKSLYEPPKVVLNGVYGQLDSDGLKRHGITEASGTENTIVVIAEPGKPVTRFSAKPESNWAGVKFSWPSYEHVVGTGTPNEVILKKNDGKTITGQPTIVNRYYERIPTFDAGEDGDQAMWVTDIRYPNTVPLTVMAMKGESVVLRGTLMDFTPRHPQTVLEYSNNFSGWSPVSVLNDYGQFELGPIPLAEGQNVIALRAKNRAGYSGNQILKILKTGITLQPVLDEVFPVEGSVTRNPRPRIALVYQNMKYTDLAEGVARRDVPGDPINTTAGNKIVADSLMIAKAVGSESVTGAMVTPELINLATQTQVLRNKLNRLEVSYLPTRNLDDGVYQVTVKAHDAYNTSS
ncbi:hypothetical protein EBR57_04235, partial [bacterium]|nr:hypothetical protein [bacterium]